MRGFNLRLAGIGLSRLQLWVVHRTVEFLHLSILSPEVLHDCSISILGVTGRLRPYDLPEQAWHRMMNGICLELRDRA